VFFETYSPIEHEFPEVFIVLHPFPAFEVMFDIHIEHNKISWNKQTTYQNYLENWDTS
jgi:hypothetical protein